MYLLNLLESLHGIYCAHFDFEMIDNCLVFSDYVESIHKPGNYVILAHCAEYLNLNYGSMYTYNIHHTYHLTKRLINLSFTCKSFQS